MDKHAVMAKLRENQVNCLKGKLRAHGSKIKNMVYNFKVMTFLSIEMVIYMAKYRIKSK